MGKIDYWKLVTMLLPLMATAQEAFSGKPGSGAKKKEFVMGLATAILGTLADSAVVGPERRAAIESAISSMVDTIVAAVNAAQSEAGGA
jgi:hypothetical protein